MNYKNKEQVQTLMNHILSNARDMQTNDLQGNKLYSFEDCTYTEEELSSVEVFTENNSDRFFLLSKLEMDEIGRLKYMNNNLCEEEQFAFSCLRYARCLNYFAPVLKENVELAFLDRYYIRHSMSEEQLKQLINNLSTYQYSDEFYTALLDIDFCSFQNFHKMASDRVKRYATDIFPLNYIHIFPELSKDELFKIVVEFPRFVIYLSEHEFMDVNFLLDLYEENNEIQDYCAINLKYYSLHRMREEVKNLGGV